MTRFDHTRRHLLIGAAAMGGLTLTPSFAHAAEDEQRDVPLSNGRVMKLSIWRPQTVRAAVVFGHGSGGQPQNYPALLDAFRAAGLLVVAPLHVDSLQHPQHDQFDRVARFRARHEDMVASLGVLQTMAPDAPQAVAGHSFGGLMAFVAGAGFPPMSLAPLPSVKAVVAFSDAGVIPNVTNEQSYAALNVPALTVTGDQDLVEGVVTDWHDHLYAYEHSPAGDKMALVYAGGTHNLIGGGQAAGASAPDAIANGADFILAYAARDAGAMTRVSALQSNAVRQVMRR